MTDATFSVAVLISAGRNPVTGTARASRGDAVAMALGRRIAGHSLRVLHAGAPEDPSLQDYLALGAGTIEVVAGSTEHNVISLLGHMLKTVDLILTGSRTEQGAGSGLLPYALAASLGRPVVANVLEAQVERNRVRVRQFLTKGKRRGIMATLPAVLVVHPFAPVELTYAHARRRSGRIVATAAEISPMPLAADDASPFWTFEPAARSPVLLKAQEKKTGHARMQSAIEMDQKGGVVAIEGSCVDKAQVVLTYLREHRLIDF